MPETERLQPERFVAVSLLTQSDLDRWAPSLRNIYPLTGADDFADLLRAVDEADMRDRGERTATRR